MKLFCIFFILFLPYTIFCQLPKNVSDTVKIGYETLKTDAKNQLIPSLYSPDGKSNLLNLISNFSISSDFTSGTSGKVEGVLPIGAGNSNKINVSVQQKIAKGNSQASLLNLNGITPNSTLNIGFQHMFWDPDITTTSDKKLFNKVGYDFLSRQGRPKGDITTLTFEQLDADALGQLKTHLCEPWFFNINFSLSSNSFQYTTDSVNLKTTKENKINTSFQAAIIKVIRNNKKLQEFLSFNFTYANNYKAGDSITLFIPFGTTNNYLQKDVSFGLPVNKSDEQFSLEYKLGIPNKTSYYFGFSPSLSYSVQMKNLLLLVPIYFISGKDSKGNIQGLNGGINLGYQTSTSGTWASFSNGFAFSLFVGVPFSVFNGN